MMGGYLVAECFEGDEIIARWTTERPGVTGPADLYRLLPELILNGWNVRAAEED